jgi:altronate dehydratase
VTQTIWAYRRANGAIGVRNHLLVVPSVICANTVAQRIAQLIPGAVAIPHPHGCAQVGDDVVITEKVLAGAAANPNVGAAVVVGLGCETCQASDVAAMAAAAAPGKLIESFYIQDAGGSIKAISHGVELGKRLMGHIAAQQREEVPLSDVVLAATPGDADPTSSRAANPTLGVVTEMLLAAGATVIQPKAALLPVHGWPAGELAVAERPVGKGRYLMDTALSEEVSVSAMAAGGSQVCLFSTGRGSPVGNAIVPVIKVSANAAALTQMADNIDFSAAALLDGKATKEQLGTQLFQMLLDVCNGQLTNAEIIGHQEFAIHRIGPTV